MSKNILLPILILILLISVSALIVATKNQLDLRNLYCDLPTGIFAEREYVYPALRDLGYDPDDYGKGIDNPLTTKDIYYKYCD
jgi:hypothetical protein